MSRGSARTNSEVASSRRPGTLQQHRGRAADDVTEQALGPRRVLVRVHPTLLLVLSDQPAGEAFDPSLVGARAVRAPPAIVEWAPSGCRSAQLLRREGLPQRQQMRAGRRTRGLGRESSLPAAARSDRAGSWRDRRGTGRDAVRAERVCAWPTTGLTAGARCAARWGTRRPRSRSPTTGPFRCVGSRPRVPARRRRRLRSGATIRSRWRRSSRWHAHRADGRRTARARGGLVARGGAPMGLRGVARAVHGASRRLGHSAAAHLATAVGVAHQHGDRA